MRALACALCAVAFGSAPSRDDLAKRAKALGFGTHATQIARDALPGARLVAGAADTVGGNRLGGAPDLPPAMHWPRCKGRTLSFLGQFRLADVAAAAPGAVPVSGVLSVFANLHADASGVLGIEEAVGQVGPSTCVVLRRLDGPLEPRRTPKRVDTLERRPVQLQATLTVPDGYVAEQRYGVKGRWYQLFDEARFGQLGHKVSDDDYGPVHQLLGWPSPVQDTPLYGCGKRSPKHPTDRLLLQLDFDETLNFAIGDGGALYISGTAADLRAGRFSALCTEFQEG